MDYRDTALRRAGRLVLAAALSCNPACSLKKRAINTLAEVLSQAEGVYLADDDPELVAAALPFNLKTIETLLQSNPDHRGLLLTATKSFVFYSFAFVEPEAVRLEGTDPAESERLRKRAARLYLRGYRYGLRGLDNRHPGFSDLLPREPATAAGQLGEPDVALAVWTAAALGSAISVWKDDPETTADATVVGELLRRALLLEESFENGIIHEFLISFETQFINGSVSRAREHYLRALELNRGQRCGTWLAWAENVAIAEQDRDTFEQLIGKVLAFDIETAPENRLLNILTQRRARFLLDQIDDLFLPSDLSIDSVQMNRKAQPAS
jgi:predicted anti-sigma-YlaC factor YlaD